MPGVGDVDIEEFGAFVDVGSPCLELFGPSLLVATSANDQIFGLEGEEIALEPDATDEVGEEAAFLA